MADVWGNPASWTQQQWLAVVIMLFVIVAIFVLLLRLITIIRMANQPTYKPNLRRFRSSTRIGSTGPDTESDNS